MVVIDQLEELFSEAPDAADRFGRLLSLLVATERVWVVTTMRADLYEKLLSTPSLKALKDVAASFDLGPPGAAELAEIVRGPAQAADLVFEKDAVTGESLDERILRDASPDILPLVQFTLHRLFEEREVRGANSALVLTNAVYARLGGLDGAVDTEAEAAIASLGENEVQALPRVLRTVAVIGEGGGEALSGPVTTKPALVGLAAYDGSSKRLVDALIAARIFLADDEEAEGKATIRLAHDRVLSVWKRAASIIEENRDFLRRRRDAEMQMYRWTSAGRSPDVLIAPGLPLAEAAVLLESRHELDRELVDFIELSIARDQAARQAEAVRSKRRQRVAVAAAVVFACIAGVAGVLGWKANVAQQVADTERLRAEREAEKATNEAQRADIEAAKATAAAETAEEQRNEARLQLTAAQVNLGRFVASKSRDLIDKDVELARLALLEVVPNGQETGFPPLPEVVRALGVVKEADAVEMLFLHTGWVSSAAWNPDESRVMTISADNKNNNISHTNIMTVWNAATGAKNFDVWGINTAAWNPRSNQVAGLASNGKLRLWDGDTGAQLLEVDGSGVLIWSPDGRRILTGRNEGLVVFDPADGKTSLTIADPRAYSRWGYTQIQPAWSGDGKWIANALPSGVVRIRDAQTGEVSTEITAPSDITYLAFSPDSGRILLSSKDDGIYISDVGTGETVSTLPNIGTTSANWSPDGTKVALINDSKNVFLLDASNGNPVRDLQGHVDRVLSLAWSGDGKSVATTSHDGTTKIWSLETGDHVDLRHGTDPAIVEVDAQGTHVSSTSASFSKDGTRLLTSSADKLAQIWRIGQSKEIVQYPENHDGYESLSLSRDHRRLLDQVKGEYIIRNAATGEIVRRFPVPDDLHRAAQSPDERLIAGVVAGTAQVHVWEAETGKEIKIFGAQATGEIAWAPDGDFIAVGTMNGVTIFDSRMEKQLAQFPQTWHFGWNSDGSKLVVADNRSLKIVDAVDLAAGEAHGINAESFAWSPDGRSLAYVAEGGEPEIFDIASNVSTPMKTDGAVTAVGPWSPDGKRILLGSGDQSGKRLIYDIEKASTVATIGNSIRVATWSPDGSTIATGGSDNTARVWDVMSGSELARHVGQGGEAYSTNVSPDGIEINDVQWLQDGRSLVVSGRDGLRVWKPALGWSPSTVITQQKLVAVRRLSDEERTDIGLGALPVSAPALVPASVAPGSCDGLAAHPSDPRKRPGSGTAFADIDVVRAEAACRQAVAAEPEEPRFRYELGRVLDKKRDYSGAREAFAFAVDAGYPMAFFNIGGMYDDGLGVERDEMQAEANYLKAVTLGAPVAGLKLGQSAWARGEERKAFDFWTQCAAAGVASCHERMAWAFEAGHGGSPQNPEQALIHYTLAERLYEGIDKDQMLRMRYRRSALARSIDPALTASASSEIAKTLQGYPPIERGSDRNPPDSNARSDGGLNFCDRFAAHSSDPGRAPGSGIAYGDINPASAEEACRKAIAENPQEPRYFYELGRALYKKEDYAGAYQAYQSARNAGYAMAFNALGGLYAEGLGVAVDQEMATSLYKQAIDQGAEIAGVSWGTLVWDKGDTEKAIEIWTRCAVAGIPFCHMELADVFKDGRNGVKKDLKSAAVHLAVAERLFEGADRYQVQDVRLRRSQLAGAVPVEVVSDSWTEAGRATQR